MTSADEARLIARLCRARAAAYGALRQSSTTALALDRAADIIERLAPTPGPASGDPMERIIERALLKAGIAYTSDHADKTPHHLDFDLPTIGIAIEVKQMHAPRIAAQMARVPHVIAAQGVKAVQFLADAIACSAPTGNQEA